jgi:hypothetical protein
MRVYGYPRSGSHLLMRSVWLTYFRNDVPDYRNLFGSHFDAPACTPSPGDAPHPGPDGVVIVRDPHAVARSVWNMRNWFGLTTPGSFEEFLARTYSDSFCVGGPVLISIDVGRGFETMLGGDAMFAGVAELPVAHQEQYCRELLQRCGRVVRYEELLSEPRAVIRQIGEWFGLPASEPVVPTGPVGYNVRRIPAGGEC